MNKQLIDDLKDMKKILIIGMALLSLVACRKKDINELKDDVKDLQGRVAVLEELCKNNNTNIASLQNLVTVSLGENDYVTNIAPITKGGAVIGYTISFKNQEPITVFNDDNKESGNMPVISVKKDTDEIYYWTINGEWLLNDLGEKMRVAGVDGNKGADGITPMLKIEDENWFVSYDEGATWTFLSSAKGAKGDSGDSMFKSVTFDDDNVYFTLSDETVISVKKYNEDADARLDSIILDLQNRINILERIPGAIMGKFSVSEGKQVYFSQGNLQYQASTNTWRFAEKQYDMIGGDNQNVSSTYDGWIDLFGWGTSGYNSKYPYMTSTEYSDYGVVGDSYADIAGTNYDWGVYNKISNGGNAAGQWRTLTDNEWDYLFSERTDASALKGLATVNGVTGMVLLPDNWTTPSDITFTSGMNRFSNTYTTSDWVKMEANGAVFLPTAGYRYGSDVGSSVGSSGGYWSSSANNFYDAGCLYFNSVNAYMSSYNRYDGRSVRLAQDVK